MIFILIGLFLVLLGLGITVRVVSRPSSTNKKNLPLVEGLPLGSIVAWNDSSIPDGWVICDGNNNTPDLRGKFILGSNDNYTLNSTGGNNSIVIGSNNMPGNVYLYTQYGFNTNCDGAITPSGCTNNILCPGFVAGIEACLSSDGNNTTINYALGGKDNPDPINIIPSSTYKIYIKKVSKGNDANCIGLWYGGDSININDPQPIPTSLTTVDGLENNFIIGDDGGKLNNTTGSSSQYMIKMDNLPSNIYQYNFAGNWGGGVSNITSMSNSNYGNYCNKKDLMAEGDYDKDGNPIWTQRKVSLLPPFISLPYCFINTGIPSGFIVAIDVDTIPPGWILCDGNNDTPNLGGRIPRSCDDGLTDYNSSGGSETLYLNKDNIPRYKTIDMNGNTASGNGDTACHAKMGRDTMTNGCKGQWNPGDSTVEDPSCPFIRVSGGNPNPDPLPLLPPYVALNFIMKL